MDLNSTFEKLATSEISLGDFNDTQMSEFKSSIYESNTADAGKLFFKLLDNLSEDVLTSDKYKSFFNDPKIQPIMEWVYLNVNITL